MIHVIASIQIQEGLLSEFIEIFKSNIPQVLKEKGCIEYQPTVDLTTGLPPQALDPKVVTIIEKWESVAALQAHLASPHMISYSKKVKDMVENLTVKVLGTV